MGFVPYYIIVAAYDKEKSLKSSSKNAPPQASFVAWARQNSIILCCAIEAVSGLRKIRSDRGTELVNSRMKAMLEKYGDQLEPVPVHINDERAEAAIKILIILT